MRGNRRAFVLVVALFVVTFISLVAFAFLNSSSVGLTTVMSASVEQQALCLAQSGIADARVKLERDPLFPPPVGDDGKFFSYSEEGRDLGGGPVIGIFDVTVDQSCADAPYFLVRLTSTGRVMRQSQEIKKTVHAEIDLSPTDRRAGHTSEDNPNFYKIVNWSEEGE